MRRPFALVLLLSALAPALAQPYPNHPLRVPHLSAELFRKETGTQILHVPYKGGGPALTAVVTGEVQMTLDTLATSLQMIEAGKLRALAISASQRSSELPDVPTMAEAGYPALTTGAWTALLAPRDTPPEIVSRLNAATNAALNAEPMAGALKKLGAEPRGGTPQTLAERLARERTKWAPIVQALNLKAE